MNAFARIVLRGWRFLRSDVRLLSLCLIGPLAFALIVGSAYSGRKLTALKATIIDQDNSALSREVATAVLATEPFVAGGYASSPAEFEKLAADGRSHICFVFPPHFERDVKSGKGSSVAVLVDAANLITGNMAATAASSVLASYSAGIDVRKIRMHGPADESRARSAALPVQLQTRTLFNPAFNANYADFLVAGFLAIAIQLAPLLVSCRSGAREIGAGAAELHAISQNPLTAAVAKCFAYTAVVWPIAWLTIRLTLWNFELPMRGSELLLAMVTLWFTANLAALGFGISCLARDDLFASEICALVTMPNFVLSGFTWPVFAIPRGMRFLAYALPMNPFVFSLRKITMMNAAAGDLGVEIGLLAAWTLAAAGIAVFGAERLMRAAKTRQLSAREARA